MQSLQPTCINPLYANDGRTRHKYARNKLRMTCIAVTTNDVGGPRRAPASGCAVSKQLRGQYSKHTLRLPVKSTDIFVAASACAVPSIATHANVIIAEHLCW